MPPDPNKPVIAFNGAITTQLTPLPHRSFAYTVTFALTSPHLHALARQKPPLHFHPYQDEYITVTEGLLGIECAGVERVIGVADGEVRFKKGKHHRLFPHFGGEGDKKTVFVLSGEESKEVFQLDTVFFQNWYGYQDQFVREGKGPSLVQVMSMFDAGASYLSLPPWVPFGRTLSRMAGIVLGRWIGGLLGYQPFYKEWTSDWDLACRKMETSWFQRRFSARGLKRE
ncbi:MAG: hypothetical protein L6R36_009038 [Xanthoria steineri]|nr:MAG: hypothetical protein L6R36_009038 [Xanthoria steineri]